VPSFLPPGETQRLARRARAQARRGAFAPARIGRGSGRQIRPEIRGDRVRWIDPADASRGEQHVLERIEGLRRAVNARLQLGVFELELHWALYPPGARYARHRDRHRDSDARVLSLVVYLNAGWQARDGGELRLHLGAGRWRDVEPRGGTLVVFDSARFAHEVLPAGRERLSLTGWLRRRAA
jgi:SM-20-related protein